MQLSQDLISNMLGLISMGISVYLFILQSKAKKWRQLEISANPVTKGSEALVLLARSFPGRIAVTDNQVSVDDLALVFLKVENTGNSPIEDRAFVGPIEIGFGESATIVDQRIIASEPENLRSFINYSLSQSSLLLAPILLNQHDQFEIALLVSSMTGLHINARLVGMAKEVVDERLRVAKSVAFRFMPKYLLIIAIAFLFMGLLLLANWLLNGHSSIGAFLISPLLSNDSFTRGFFWGLAVALFVGNLSRLMLFFMYRAKYEFELEDRLKYIFSDR